MITSREIQLKSRPIGPITKDNFELVTVNVRSPGENEVLIKNLWQSIDAGQRQFMGAGDKNFVDLPPKRFELGQPMEGQSLGQVIESRSRHFPVGTYVSHNYGWREYFVRPGKPNRFTLSPIKNPVSPLYEHLNAISLYGAAAYFFLTQSAQVKAGETVWISTAAGSTGSIACQIARISGCRVVGTTSSDEKVAWLQKELKIDAAINYKKGDLRAAMKAVCPEGIDVFLDLAGGDQLEAAIDLLNPHGRIVKAGDTAAYDTNVPVGPRNMFLLAAKRLQIKGSTIFQYLEPASWIDTFEKRMTTWVLDGKVKSYQTIYEGLDKAVQAQIDLFQGKNMGKMLLKIGDTETFS
jgi:hypothetical protein